MKYPDSPEQSARVPQYSPNRQKPRASEPPINYLNEEYQDPSRIILGEGAGMRRPRPSQLPSDNRYSQQDYQWEGNKNSFIKQQSPADFKTRLAQFAQKHEEISQRLQSNRSQIQPYSDYALIPPGSNRVASPDQLKYPTSASFLDRGPHQNSLNKDNPNFSSFGNLPRPVAYQASLGPGGSPARQIPDFLQQGYQNKTTNISSALDKLAHVTNKRQPRASEPVRESPLSEDYNINTPQKSVRLEPVKHSNSLNQPQSQPVHQQIPVIREDAFKKPGALKETVSTYYTSNSKQSSNRSNQSERKGFQLSDFKVGKQLGSGKFGSVFLVQHKLTGFVCAMKRIPKSAIREEHIINQMIRQIKIQSALDHPNIVKLYGFFHDKEHMYLLMELGSSGQLYHVIKKQVRLAEPSVAYTMKQVCEAIRYLHFFKIIHRDLKPENIVIQSGTVKLCDFGWAVIRGSELRNTFCGTPLYVSPEILKGHHYDQRIDLWGIGVLTYQLLVGNIPFDINCEQELIKIIKQDIIFPQDIPISDVAKDFILRILKKNPEDRIKIAELLQHQFLAKVPQLAPELEAV